MSDWRDQAECAGDPNPDAWHSVEPDQMVYAQAVCARCLVAWDCLGHAIDSAQPWGTWGGLSQVERDAGPALVDHLAGQAQDTAIKAARKAADLEQDKALSAHRASERNWAKVPHRAAVSGAA